MPKWTYLRAGTKLSMMEWGEHVIIKPINFGFASKGRGVELIKTDYTGSLVLMKAGAPEEKKRKYIIQKFIDSGTYSEDYRVLTLFGRALYALKRASDTPLERPDNEQPRITSGVVSNADGGGSRSLNFCYEEDVLKFAGTCYRAIPNVPLQAVDVRREVGTGRLYCLEINPGGLTWNFSSKRAKNLPLIDGIRREQQLGAWGIAAEALIENVRLFAS